MTEKEIQAVLVPDMLKRQDMVFPNTKAIHKRFESDLIRVTKSLIVYEYEIKRTRSDFYVDFKKHRKTLLIKHVKWNIMFYISVAFSINKTTIIIRRHYRCSFIYRCNNSAIFFVFIFKILMFTSLHPIFN